MIKTKAVFFTLLTVLAYSTSAFGKQPVDWSAGIHKPTKSGLIRVTLSCPCQAIPLNSIHSWNIRLSHEDGSPISDATIKIAGGMPGHGHGFPTRPVVVATSEQGLYKLNGLKFSMLGQWLIELSVNSSVVVADKVSFVVEL